MIGKIRAIHFLMKCPRPLLEVVGFRIAFAIRQRVPVPLGVSEFAGQYRSIGRNRVSPPMNENSKLGVTKPCRRGTLIDGVPGGFIALR